MRRILTLFLSLLIIAIVTITIYYVAGEELASGMDAILKREELKSKEPVKDLVVNNRGDQCYSVYEETREEVNVEETKDSDVTKEQVIPEDDQADVPVEEAAKADEVTSQESEEQQEKTRNNPLKNEVSLSSKERQLLKLLNSARRSKNLPELIVNEQLTRAARAKSKDMAVNNYFSHTSPVYGELEGLLNYFNINYSYAGENLAMDSCGNIVGVHEGLMSSPDHRRNILNRNYVFVGVGIYERSDGYHYYTQLFKSD